MTGDTGAQMKKSDEIEEMLRSGKVVKIEPMPKPVVPPPLPAGILKSEMTREDRLKIIAAKIVELSDQRLSTHKNPKYVALKIGSGPYSNAVVVHNNLVSFFIRSGDLLNWAKKEEFDPVEAPKTTPMNEHKLLFRGLGLSDIEAHEALFREIVMESVRMIMDRKPKKK
jgi:hypothetical protein